MFKDNLPPFSFSFTFLSSSISLLLHALGTPAYAPPEWFDNRTYWARPTTVWQLGALFYSLLNGREYFSTTDLIHNHIQINSALSRGK